jgi:predicted GNAT family acetyltransferase
MPWILTHDLDAYTAAAGPLLMAEPESYTVLLSVLSTLASSGAHTFGSEPPVLGWWESPAGIAAAMLWTRPYPLQLTRLPDPAAAELATALGSGYAASVTDAIGTEADLTAFAAAWSAATGARSRIRQRQRLYRLGVLTPPDPAPEGAPRVATLADESLMSAWEEAFGIETGHTERRSATAGQARLRQGGLLFWEVAGEPAAMAAITPAIAGVARVGLVYTPAANRGRGYGAAVTVAASRLALDRGAESVILFTDLANPTSNALYQRLGYRPIADKLMLGFDHGPTETWPGKGTSR